MKQTKYDYYMVAYDPNPGGGCGRGSYAGGVGWDTLKTEERLFRSIVEGAIPGSTMTNYSSRYNVTHAGEWIIYCVDRGIYNRLEAYEYDELEAAGDWMQENLRPYAYVDFDLLDDE